MVFGKSYLQIQNKFGFVLKFEPKSALKMVNNHQDTVKVAHSDVWYQSRSTFFILP